jgi:zinc protease
MRRALAVAIAVAVVALSLPRAHATGRLKPRLMRPSLPAPRAWRPPIPVEAVTPAGTRVVVLRDGRLPLVHVLVSISAGSALDPPARPGQAAAVLSMLQDGGAGTRTAPEVAEALAELGTELRESIDPDEAQLELTVLARDLPRALALLGDIVARPRFDAGEWPGTRSRRLGDIARRSSDRADIADDTFTRALFGDHPYAHMPFGTPAAIAALTVDELRAFHRARYGPRTVAFVLSGDVEPGQVTAAVTRALSGWHSDAHPAPSPPAPPEPAKPHLVLVDQPGAPQSELRVGFLGRARDTPDYPALQLLRMVLGGSFTSRLNQNLRERHGYSYGAQVHFEYWRAPGAIRVQAAVRTDATAAALTETLRELAAMRGPFGGDELHKGKSLLEAAVVEAFSDDEQSCGWLADLVTHGLPLDSWSRLLPTLAALDTAAVTSVAQALFTARPLTIVVVGDRKQVERSLRSLPGGFVVEHRDVDGKLLD